MAPKESKTEYEAAIHRAVEEWRSVGNYRAAHLPKRSLAEELRLAVGITYDIVYFTLCATALILHSIFKLFIPQRKKSIKGQVAVVTGGANGLGKSLATELAKNGARVAIVDIDGIAAMETVDDLKRVTGSTKDGRFYGYKIDVSDPQQVKKLREQITSDFGESASIIVNNAGLIPVASLTGGTDDDIRRVMDVNCNAQYWMIREFLPAMKARNSGHILTISSLAAEIGLSRAVVYSATKAAISCMSTSLRDELEDDGFDGINISVAYPYFIATRKTLVDVVRLRIPPVTPESAAKTIIDGMLKNKLQIGVPTVFMYLSAWMRICPDTVLRLFRNTFTIEIPRINDYM